MKFMTTWSVFPGSIQEAVDKFLAGEGAPQDGVTLLGRWHNVDCSGGFSLFETDRPEQLYMGAAKWSELMDISTVAVIEDAEAGPVLANVFKQ